MVFLYKTAQSACCLIPRFNMSTSVIGGVVAVIIAVLVAVISSSRKKSTKNDER